MHKYVVRLDPEARKHLLALVHPGWAAAGKLLHARILLKADVVAGGRRWTDAEMAEALDTSAAAVHRVRQTWAEQGLEAALARKRPIGRQYRQLDGVQEAPLIAVACRAPPEGRGRWTLKRLADKLVTLDIVETFSKVTERRTAVDFAHVMQELGDAPYPQAEKSVLVMDHLNTPKPASL